MIPHGRGPQPGAAGGGGGGQPRDTERRGISMLSSISSNDWLLIILSAHLSVRISEVYHVDVGFGMIQQFL